MPARYQLDCETWQKIMCKMIIVPNVITDFNVMTESRQVQYNHVEGALVEPNMMIEGSIPYLSRITIIDPGHIQVPTNPSWQSLSLWSRVEHWSPSPFPCQG